nr:hypothetical protein Iba_chr13dCG6100 [Ipomoea batatas]
MSATAFCSWVTWLICPSFISRSSKLQAQIRLSTILLNLLPRQLPQSSLAMQPQPALLKRGGEGGAFWILLGEVRAQSRYGGHR